MPHKSSKRKAAPSPSPKPSKKPRNGPQTRSSPNATSPLKDDEDDDGESDLSSTDTTASRRIAELETQNALLLQQLDVSEKKFDNREKVKLEAAHERERNKLERGHERVVRKLERELAVAREDGGGEYELEGEIVQEREGEVDLEIENKTLREMVKEEREKRQRLRKELAEQRVYEVVWEGRAEKAIDELKEKNGKLNAAQGQIVALGQEIEERDDALDNLKESVLDKHEEGKRLRREVEKVEDTFLNVQNDLTITQTQVIMAHQTIEGREERIAELKMKLQMAMTEMDTRVEDKNRRKEYYKMANDVLVETIEGLEKKVETSESKLACEKNLAKDLQTQLRIKREEAEEKEITVIRIEGREAWDMYRYECEN